jgi:prohibitin 2
MSVLLFLLFFGCLAAGVVVTVLHAVEDGSVKAGFQKATLLYLAAVPLFFIWMGFTTVDTGYRGIVTRFGNISRTLNPGAHFIVPFFDEVHPIAVQTLTVKPNEDAASHDLQMVKVQVTLAYHFDPAHVDYIYSQLADASDNAVENKIIVPAILEAIKATTAKYDAQQLVSERPAVRDGIETFVLARLSPYHIIAENVSITDFAFSDEFSKSIEAKVTAQQHAEKAQNDLQRIQIEAQQQVAQAKGEAEALRAQKEQITPELLQLRTIEMMKEKWDGQLPQNYYGGTAPLPMMEVLKAGPKRAQ